jgi:hypothetical protein
LAGIPGRNGSAQLIGVISADHERQLVEIHHAVSRGTSVAHAKRPPQ